MTSPVRLLALGAIGVVMSGIGASGGAPRPIRQWQLGAAPLPSSAEDAVDPILIDGPCATFENQSDAVVSWRTRTPRPSILEYRRPDENPIVVAERRPKRRHAIKIRNLHRNTEYTYRIRLHPTDADLATREYVLDTEFDFSVPELRADRAPYPKDALTRACAKAAAYILRESGIDRGYCLDVGCGEGRLAYEIARRSKLQVIGVSTDRGAVAAGRARLIAAGAYGCRVTLRHVNSLRRLPFPDLCANLIVSGEITAGGRPRADAGEIVRKLRPLGGKAYVGAPAGARSSLAEQRLEQWLRESPDSDPETHRRLVKGAGGLWAVIDRAGPLPGAGDWTHAYGAAGQTANSNDELVRGQAGQTLEVQWFGLPGPNAMMDRQVRMEGPVSAAGRIFTQGQDRLIGQDAYNGTILWSLEIPHLRRTNIPRNTGNLCTNGDHVFVAVRDRCWQLDAATGRPDQTYHVADDPDDTRYDWGYVATEGGTLFGSAVKRGNMETDFIGPEFWFDDTSGPDTHNVCSDYLFAQRIHDGKRLWTHSEGLVINPTISLGGNQVYFLESRSPEAVESSARKLGAELWRDVYLVAVDADSGETAWESRFEVASQPIVVYLVYHDGQIAVIDSREGQYHTRAFAAADGRPLWQTAHPWRRDNHGHHIQHPVIAQDRLFLEPKVYDWRTGDPVELEFPARSKCGTITAAANLLHYRDYNDEVWDLSSNTQSEFSRLRSNCWIGMISGNGLLMSPESGGGCSCQWPIYTSLVHRTKDDY